MKILFFLWLGVCFALPAFTQTLNTGKFRGEVLDSAGKPVAGVVVQLKQGNFAKATESDSTGKFTIAFLPAGQYALTVEAAHIVVVGPIVIASGQILSSKITLQTDSTGNDLVTFLVSPSSSITSVSLEQAIREFTAAHAIRIADADRLQLDIGWCAPVPPDVPVHAENRTDISAAEMEKFGWRSLAEEMANY